MVNVVNPIDVGKRAVAAVDHDPTALGEDLAGHLPAGEREKRSGRKRGTHRFWNAVPDDAGCPDQFFRDTIRDDVGFASEVCHAARQREVRHIHATRSNEVCGHYRQRAHAGTFGTHGMALSWQKPFMGRPSRMKDGKWR